VTVLLIYFAIILAIALLPIALLVALIRLVWRKGNE